MFLRKYWLPLSVFLVAIVGIGLYLLATQPPKEPIRIYKVVEPEEPTEQPKAEVVEDDTSQGGHVHADGTWHEGSHEAHETSEQSTVQGPDLQQYVQHIPANLLEAQRLVSVDLARAKAAFRAALPEDPFSDEFEAAVKSAVQTAVDLHSIVYDLPPGDPRRVESAIAHNLMMTASNEATALSKIFIDTGNPIYRERIDEIHSWDDPYEALFPKPAPMSDEDLAATRKAADEFDARFSVFSEHERQRLEEKGLGNIYRERVKAEEKRRQQEENR